MKITKRALRQIIKEEVENALSSRVVFSDLAMEGSGGGPLQINGKDLPPSDPIYRLYNHYLTVIQPDEGGGIENAEELLEYLHNRGVTHYDATGIEDPFYAKHRDPDGTIELSAVIDRNFPGLADELFGEDWQFEV